MEKRKGSFAVLFMSALLCLNVTWWLFPASKDHIFALNYKIKAGNMHWYPTMLER